MRRTKRGGWPYSQPPNVPFTINRASPQADGLVLWMPWGGGAPGAHARHVDRIGGLVFTEAGTPVWVADGERGWSLLFDDVQNEYLTVASPVVTGAPCTLAAWFRSDDDAANQVILSISAGGNVCRIDLVARGNLGGDKAYLRTQGTGGIANFGTTTGYTVNTWHHACAVEIANDDRAVYIDSGSKNTDNTDVVGYAGASRTSIGEAYNAGAPDGKPFSGRIADARIYNRALTDMEVRQLYANPWELYKPLTRRIMVGVAAAPPVGPFLTTYAGYSVPVG